MGLLLCPVAFALPCSLCRAHSALPHEKSLMSLSERPRPRATIERHILPVPRPQIFLENPGKVGLPRVFLPLADGRQDHSFQARGEKRVGSSLFFQRKQSSSGLGRPPPSFFLKKRKADQKQKPRSFLLLFLSHNRDLEETDSEKKIRLWSPTTPTTTPMTTLPRPLLFPPFLRPFPPRQRPAPAPP